MKKNLFNLIFKILMFIFVFCFVLSYDEIYAYDAVDTELTEGVVVEATCAYNLGGDKRFVIVLKSVNGSITYTTDCNKCLTQNQYGTYGIQYALESSFSPYNFVDKEKNVFSCISEIYGVINPVSPGTRSTIVNASLYLIKPDRNNVQVHELDPSLSKYPSGKLSAENEDNPLNVCIYKKSSQYSSYNIKLRIYKDRIESDDNINLSTDIKPEMFYEECPVLSINGNNTGFNIEKADNLPAQISSNVSGETPKTKDDIDKEVGRIEGPGDGEAIDPNCDGIFGSTLLDRLANYYKIIQICAPILLIALSSFDFLKAIISEDQSALQKSFKTAITRAIVAIIIFFVPYFVNLLLMMPGIKEGIESSTCGIENRESSTQIFEEPKDPEEVQATKYETAYVRYGSSNSTTTTNSVTAASSVSASGVSGATVSAGSTSIGTGTGTGSLVISSRERRDVLYVRD